MDIFIFWFILSFVIMHFAKQKGLNEGLYLMVSLILSPIIGGLLLLIADSKKDVQQLKRGIIKKCPYCAETIKAEAIRCKHCGASLPDGIPVVTETVK